MGIDELQSAIKVFRPHLDATSIRAQYTREKQKSSKVKTGTGTDEVYVLKWPHLEQLKFLDDFIITKKSISNLSVIIIACAFVITGDQASVKASEKALFAEKAIVDAAQRKQTKGGESAPKRSKIDKGGCNSGPSVAPSTPTELPDSPNTTVRDTCLLKSL
ncbi:hypothetical protein EMCRGX_G016706 [Ephydatia muelleri]